MNTKPVLQNKSLSVIIYPAKKKLGKNIADFIIEIMYLEKGLKWIILEIRGEGII